MDVFLFQTFNPADYTKASTYGKVEFYWRLVNDDKEVEGVAIAKDTLSYVAVGNDE